MFSGVANSMIGGGAHIYIFEFTDRENNRFQKKLIVKNMNIQKCPAPPIIKYATPLAVLFQNALCTVMSQV